MRRHFRGRLSRPRFPTKWTGQQQSAEATVAAGAQTDIIVVAASDYEGGSVSGNVEAGGCTLLRIRGTINVRATVIGGLAYMALYTAGVGESVTLNSAAQIASGDTLWHDLIMVPIDTSRHIEIDVKAKRLLENDAVIFSIRAVAQTVTYCGQWRALLKSSG